MEENQLQKEIDKMSKSIKTDNYKWLCEENSVCNYHSGTRCTKII